jgi:two-component system phosphate regulon sensor histidine kinase PhoR
VSATLSYDSHAICTNSGPFSTTGSATLDVLSPNLVVDKSPQAQTAGVNVEFDVAAKLFVAGDRDRLAQVFANLLDNSISHTPAGGRVTVTARHVAEEPVVEVTVSDTGAGIPAVSLSRVFERFYQVDKSRPGGGRRGAGLGLPIAQEIIRAYGGEITAHNQPGQGSVFVVKIPTVRPDAPQKP